VTYKVPSTVDTPRTVASSIALASVHGALLLDHAQ
jgi:hypothetical protein